MLLGADGASADRPGVNDAQAGSEVADDAFPGGAMMPAWPILTRIGRAQTVRMPWIQRRGHRGRARRGRARRRRAGQGRVDGEGAYFEEAFVRCRLGDRNLTTTVIMSRPQCNITAVIESSSLDRNIATNVIMSQPQSDHGRYRIATAI